MQDQLLTRFKENVPAARLSRNLRNLLLQYLALQKDGHPFNIDDLLADLIPLFELLDGMEET